MSLLWTPPAPLLNAFLMCLRDDAQVLGHLGFDFEDEQGVPHGPEGKRSPAKRVPGRGTSQYLSWGGTSAMSFEVSPTRGRLTRLICSSRHCMCVLYAAGNTA